MTITCASSLTSSTPKVKVPGSVTLLIDLANDQASGIAELEFTLLDPTLAVCFANGGRVMRVQKSVPNIGLAVVDTLALKCCHGNMHTVNTVLPIGVSVWEKGVLRCAPSTVVTVSSHACAQALVPLHKAKASPFAALLAQQNKPLMLTSKAGVTTGMTKKGTKKPAAKSLSAAAKRQSGRGRTAPAKRKGR